MMAVEVPWSSASASAPVPLSLASPGTGKRCPGQGPWATSWAAELGSSEQSPKDEASVVPAYVSKDCRGLTQMNVNFMYFKMRANGHLRMEEIRCLWRCASADGVWGTSTNRVQNPEQGTLD